MGERRIVCATGSDSLAAPGRQHGADAIEAAELAEVARRCVTELHAALDSQEAVAAGARIALARLSLAAGMPVPGGSGLAPTGVPRERTDALRLGQVAARCLAALGESESSYVLDAGNRALLPKGLRLLLEHAFDDGEPGTGSTGVRNRSEHAGTGAPLTVSRVTATDGRASAAAVVASGLLLPLDGDAGWRVECDAGPLVFLPCARPAGTDIVHAATTRKLVIGLVTQRRADGGRWTTAHYVLSQPRRPDGFDILVTSTAGNLTLAGRAHVDDGGQARWWMHSAGLPGGIPARLEGTIAIDVVSIKSARAARPTPSALMARRQRRVS